MHYRRGGSGQGDYRGGPEGGQILAEHAIVRAEIVAPLGNAVGFVDGDQGRLALGKHLGKASDAQALGCDEEELQGAVEVVDASLARGRAIAPGVYALHREAPFFEFGYLIFHEGDQRTDHQGSAAARHRRQLVAEGLAGSGRHYQQDVAARNDGPADGFLAGAERGESECRLEEVG